MHASRVGGGVATGVNPTMLQRLARFTSLCQQDFISANEFVEALLMELAELEVVGDSREVLSLVQEEVADLVQSKLIDLRKVEYRWTPFVVGPGWSDERLVHLAKRLKETDEELNR